VRDRGDDDQIKRSNETRQAKYTLRNVEARSPSHCCSGNAINITYSARVFGALDLQHAKRMRRIIVISCTYCPTVFFPHSLINGKIFAKKKIIEHEMCSC